MRPDLPRLAGRQQYPLSSARFGSSSVCIHLLLHSPVPFNQVSTSLAIPRPTANDCGEVRNMHLPNLRYRLRYRHVPMFLGTPFHPSFSRQALLLHTKLKPQVHPKCSLSDSGSSKGSNWAKFMPTIPHIFNGSRIMRAKGQ